MLASLSLRCIYQQNNNTPHALERHWHATVREETKWFTNDNATCKREGVFTPRTTAGTVL